MDNIDLTIKNAKDGDTAAARELLKEFCACVENNTDSNGNPHRRFSGVGNEVVTNTQIDERIIRYLAECFEKILADAPGVRADANHALNVVEAGQRGKKKTAAGHKEVLNIGFEVMKRHKEIKNERKQASLRGSVSPLEQAKNDIAKRHNKGFDTIEAAYKEWNKLIKQATG